MRRAFATVAGEDERLGSIWSCPDPVRSSYTAGDRMIDEAVRASYRAAVAKDLAGRDAFHATRGFVDPAVAAAAAADYARASLAVIDRDDSPPSKRPFDSPLGRYFRRQYTVGSEALWRDIPWLVLLEIFAHAALILRQCVIEDLPEGIRQRVREHPLYRLGVELPLKATYSVIRFARQASATFKVLAGVAAALALTVLGITYLHRDSLLYDKGSIAWTSAFFLVVLPLMGLWTLLSLIQAFVGRSWRPTILKALLLAAIVATLFSPIRGLFSHLAACTKLAACM